MKFVRWMTLVFSLAQATGTTIVSHVDFDDHHADNHYSFSYSEQGVPHLSNSPGMTREQGIIGRSGAGLSVAVDFTGFGGSGPDYNWSGFGLGMNLLTSGPLPSRNLPDYRIRLDLMVGGAFENLSTVGGQLKVVFDGPSYSQCVLMPVLFESSGWQTMTLGLPESEFTSDEIREFAVNQFGVTTIQLMVSVTGGPGLAVAEPNDFGFDAGNFLAIDNVEIFTIPEPSVALFLMVAPAFFFRRKRRPGELTS